MEQDCRLPSKRLSLDWWQWQHVYSSQPRKTEQSAGASAAAVFTGQPSPAERLLESVNAVYASALGPFVNSSGGKMWDACACMREMHERLLQRAQQQLDDVWRLHEQLKRCAFGCRVQVLP